MSEILAPAKINLFLLVGERRADGYHPILSLMEKVTLYDRLRLERGAAPGVRLTGAGLPAGVNTVETAARLLLEEAGSAGQEPGVIIELGKAIPVAAGLAGGSSDAASALDLLQRELGLSISAKRLAVIARQIGADVPFFLRPGTCLAAGAGEELTPIELPFSYWVVLVTQPAQLSTAEVYRLFDEMCPEQAGSFARRSQRWRAASAAIPDLKTLCGLLANDLEPPAISRCPEIGQIKEELLAEGALGALMSGSGPSVYALFAGEIAADAAAAALTARGRLARVVAPLH